jgi:hypothetical protein
VLLVDQSGSGGELIEMAEMASNIPIDTVGPILEGKQAARFVEVIRDSCNTGGFLIFTYADASRAPEAFDSWVEHLQDVVQYFREAGWRIDWLPS